MNFDAVLVFSYLILTLIYGLYVGRNVKDIKDYAVGDRKFTTPVLAATIIATYASSSGFNIDITKAYGDGILNFCASCGQMVGLLIICRYIAPRMREFLGAISVCEIMGGLYGKKTRVISSLPVFIEAAGFVAIQVKVLCSILEYFSGLDSNISIPLTTLVVTLYSAFGGIKAVTFTDMVQFATFALVIPIALILAWHSVDIVSNKSDFQSFFDHITYINPEKIDYYKLLFLYLLLPGMDAPTVQRMLMAKNTVQIRESFVLSTKFLFAIMLISNFIGYILHVQNPELEQTQVIPYLIDKFSYPGMKGLFLIGIFAMAMSTADSNLNAGAVCFAHDFCGQIKYLKNLNPLLVSKIFSFIIGIGGYVLAVYFQDIIDLILFVGGLHTAIVTVPILLALFGFRSTTKSVLVGMGCGVFTICFWDHINEFLEIKDPYDSFIPGILAHIIGLFGTHYLFNQEGGWGMGPGKGMFNSPDLESQYIVKHEGVISFIKENFSSAKNFFSLLKNDLPQTVFLYNNLAIYSASISILCFMFLKDINGYDTVILLGALLSAFSLISRNLINDKDTYILLPLYVFTITYCFPFLSTYVILKSNFADFSIVLGTLSLIIIQVLMSTRFATFVMITGSIAAVIIFGMIYGFDLTFSLIISSVGVILFSLISITSVKKLISNSNWRFIKEILLHNRILKDKNVELDVRIASREDSIKKLYNLKSEIMNNFSHEIRTPLHATGNYMDVAIIRSEDKGYKKEDVGELVKKAKESFDGLKKYILRLSDLSEFQTKKMLFQMTRYDLMDILQNLKDEYHGIVDIHLYCRKDSGTVMMCDVIKIKSVFKELIENSITHAKANFIEVRVRPKEDRIDVVYSEMPGKNFKSIISEDKLFEPFEVLRDSSEGYKGLGLALVKEIMIRHHGSIEGKWEEIEYGFDVPGYAPKRQLIFSLTFDKKRYIPSDGANYEDHQLNKSSKIKFLLVDDDTTILKSTSLMLESQGYEVFCAEGGEAAIDFIASEVEDIQFVLLDIMMPDKDGFQVLDSVWDIIQKRNIKVIIQSGAAIATDYASYMKKYESLTFCSKPYSLAELKQSILLASEDKKTKNIL